jgi:hypothetical protein
MGTQGIVSVIVGGKMEAKVIAGCNGQNAAKLADLIRNYTVEDELVTGLKILGYPKLAARVELDPEHAPKKVMPSYFRLRPLARQAGFGCDDCLIVQAMHRGRIAEDGTPLPPRLSLFGISDLGAEGEELEHRTGEDHLSKLYDRFKRTFDDPRFNPRWERGTAEYVEVVEIAGV